MRVYIAPVPTPDIYRPYPPIATIALTKAQARCQKVSRPTGRHQTKNKINKGTYIECTARPLLPPLHPCPSDGSTYLIPTRKHLCICHTQKYTFNGSYRYLKKKIHTPAHTDIYKIYTHWHAQISTKYTHTGAYRHVYVDTRAASESCAGKDRASYLRYMCATHFASLTPY